ncbi:hypothetical protein F3087_18840 [Nocardia colli]|uniref:Uncharacterized protein n=1 Tax=Nocardia colli TaxID=2545717 RepID=A0A5N0EFI5_9NOCA|nr:hypothetical protein [Nocardia colli]KAA8887706.1 hypothetical protein F3087_18840 [Nocardia colli]
MSRHATPVELLDAVYYASTVITIGRDPDHPDRVVAHTFQADDGPAAPPVALAVAKLRELADALESGGAE